MKPIAVSIEALRRAASTRRPGYMEACLRRGQLSPDGKMITFARHDFTELRRIFNPRAGVMTLKPGCC